jgi:hypothetical protein
MAIDTWVHAPSETVRRVIKETYDIPGKILYVQMYAKVCGCSFSTSGSEKGAFEKDRLHMYALISQQASGQLAVQAARYESQCSRLFPPIIHHLSPASNDISCPVSPQRKRNSPQRLTRRE